MLLLSSFVEPLFVVRLPLVPVDAFNLCAIAVDPRLTLVPISIGTIFGAWLRSFQFRGSLITGNI